MNKKTFIISLVALFLFTGVIQAQTSEMHNPRLLPDSPFYFLKSWTESIGTFFTFRAESKVKRFLNLSERRLAEAIILNERGKTELAEETLEEYQNNFESAMGDLEKSAHSENFIASLLDPIINYAVRGFNRVHSAPIPNEKVVQKYQDNLERLIAINIEIQDRVNVKLSLGREKIPEIVPEKETDKTMEEMEFDSSLDKIAEQPKEKEPLDPIEEKPLVTVVDCGEIHPDNFEDQKKMEECWNLRFKDCKPAKMIYTIDMSPLAGLVSYYYEIIGPDNNLCKVKSSFLKNPNPNWIGKEMICKYDNSEDFETTVQDFIGKCSGPLYELMTEGIQLHRDSNCTLKSNVAKINLLKGVGSSITVSDFKGMEDQVVWQVKDTNIATVSPSNGKMTVVKTINVGSTEIIATDTAIGSGCFVSILLTVSQ